MSIARHGLKKLFPPQINLLSGPGCPICVTPTGDIDKSIAIGKSKNVILATFGDMFNVPGSTSSLSKEHGKGMDIRVVYSSSDALQIAEKSTKNEVVFLGVGFETTSPTIAATVLKAKQKKVKNFSVLPMFKLVPPALMAILKIKQRKIHGFILPGHVSAIIGSKPYDFVSREFNIPGVISGFEPEDILESVKMLFDQIKNRKSGIQIQYTRSVTQQGNKIAQQILKDVFRVTDSEWRGIGSIPKSGLTFNKNFDEFNALNRFKIKISKTQEPKGCLCGKILLGLNSPRECRFFGKACTPSNPIGPCMVSSEGTCAAVFKYGV